MVNKYIGIMDLTVRNLMTAFVLKSTAQLKLMTRPCLSDMAEVRNMA